MDEGTGSAFCRLSLAWGKRVERGGCLEHVGLSAAGGAVAGANDEVIGRLEGD